MRPLPLAFSVFIFVFSSQSIASEQEKASEMPNIVIYMADDLGFGSINGNGAEQKFVRTPNINSLAARGVNFTNAFATASVCSPTRYAMLTGQYSWRTELKRGVVDSKGPMLIKPDTVTLASWLKGKGYDTAHVGKWHLGYKSKPYKNLLGSLVPGPNDIGFDYHFAVPNNLDDVHKVYVEDNSVYQLKSNKMKPYGKSWYGNKYDGYDAKQRVTEEVMEYTTTKAIDWLNSRGDKPFLLYYAAVAVHHPIRPAKSMKGTSGAGLYGDFIHETDYSVGRIANALAKLGKLDNTIFIFTSDNGGDLPVKPFHDGKDWPERTAFDLDFKYNGKGVRGDKHSIYEGGLKVPFVVSWPARVSANRASNSLVSTMDIFPTIASLVGETLADDVSPDGISFSNDLIESETALNGRKLLVNRDVQGRRSIRYDEWKYISNEIYTRSGQKQRAGDVELYNLFLDQGETKNLASEYPDVVLMLASVLNEIVNTPRSKTISQVDAVNSINYPELAADIKAN